MADYRLSVYVAKRGDGRSATSMAAYRASENIYDERTGERFNYTVKRGVRFTHIFTPEGAPEWAQDRQQLWNRSEAAHKRENAVVAREIQLSLPHELTDAQRRELTGQFAQWFADRYDVAVDTAIHAPGKGGDDRNHHAHLLICTRTFDASKPHGLGNNVREFDAVAAQRAGQDNAVETWRAEWADQVNQALDRAQVRTADGAAVTVDHRSYKRQGIDQEPMVKEGTDATAKRRRGEPTELGQLNDSIRARNAERDYLEQEIAALERQIAELQRRQAAHLTAEQVQSTILGLDQKPQAEPAKDNLVRRRAATSDAGSLKSQLTPSNDNHRDVFSRMIADKQERARRDRDREPDP